jgi:phosphodiesterase/alkaline phosphatase D-like protein
MKKVIKLSLTIIIIISAIALTECQKEKKAIIPILTTTTSSNITPTSATSGGNITDDGGATVTSRGVCWSTGITPTISDGKTSDGEGAGSFSSNITGLDGGTIYYVRAYATNSVGTGYGMVMSFTTLGQSPVPTVATPTNLNPTSATLNGFVNANYLSTVVTFEYGTSTSYGSTITATQSPVTGDMNTSVSADITGLTAGTIYHYRTKAVNSLGTTYSDDITFTTLGQAPDATTQAATNTTGLSTTLNGSINAHYLSTVVTFDYGITINYDNSVTSIQSPVTGNSTISVNSNIMGLSPNAIYHYRVKAVNVLGTTYGSDMTFTTLGQMPTSTTQAATNIQTFSSTLNGNVNANYLASTVTFEYGKTTSYGSTVTATQSPVTGSANTSVSVSITGLNEGTLYHYRVKAINALGTSNGSDITFTTLGQVPTVSALAATNITSVAAQLNGTVNANYLSTVVTFEYGTSTSYGNIITATQSPVTGNVNTEISVNIINLTVGTTYHYRIKAENSLGSTYGSDMTFEAAYKIGENIFGGIIFYIDGTGLHGLVCAPSDQGSAEWGCSGTTISGADGIAIGTGSQNTTDILNGCPTAGIAARLCRNYTGGGYNDWFLPSKYELRELCINKSAIGNFTSGWYWSSSEKFSDTAERTDPLGGVCGQDYISKAYIYYVRAVRAF